MVIKIEDNSNVFEWKDAKFILAGEPGTWKTTFLAQGINPLFFCFDPGLGQLPVKNIRIKTPKDLIEADELICNLVASGKFDYTILVIDTLDEYINVLDDMAMEWAHQSYSAEIMKKVEVLGDLEKGAGYIYKNQMTMHFIKRWSDILPCPIGIISHIKFEQIGKGKDAIQKSVLAGMSEKMAKQLMGYVDHVIVTRKKVVGNNTTVYLNTEARIDCIGKSRGSEGLIPKPLIPQGLIWTRNPKENFDKFRAFFK